MSTDRDATDRLPPVRFGVVEVCAVVVRPLLWCEAVSMLWALARRGWWRRPPYVPVPDPTYLRWRLQTAYGGDGTRSTSAQRARDLVSFLRFRRALRRGG